MYQEQRKQKVVYLFEQKYNYVSVVIDNITRICFITDPGCYDLTKPKKNQATNGTPQPSHRAYTTVPNKNMSSHLERYIYVYITTTKKTRLFQR